MRVTLPLAQSVSLRITRARDGTFRITMTADDGDHANGQQEAAAVSTTETISEFVPMEGTPHD